MTIVILPCAEKGNALDTSLERIVIRINLFSVTRDYTVHGMEQFVRRRNKLVSAVMIMNQKKFVTFQREIITWSFVLVDLSVSER
jgi:hypothetical protein